MLGPGLSIRSQRAYDNVKKLADASSRQWAARIKAEEDSKGFAGSIPDEMMNDLSDSEDEMMMAIHRHAPTPPSLPSSPILASMPKPIDANASMHTLQSNGIERKHNWHQQTFSPVDTDGESVGSTARWQSRPRRRTGHQSIKRRCSDLTEHMVPIPAVTTRSQVSGRTKFFQLALSGSKERQATRHCRQSSSRHQISRKNSSSAGLRNVQGGRVAKRTPHHRGLI